MALSGSGFGVGDSHLRLVTEVLGTWFWLTFMDPGLRIRREAWRARLCHGEGETHLALLGLGRSLGHRSAEIFVSNELRLVGELLVVSCGLQDVKG